MLVLALAGCGGGGEEPADCPCAGEAACACDGGGGGETPGACEREPEGRSEAVCQAWSCARGREGRVAWSGSVAACDPGDDDANRAAALQLVNAYRLVADLPALVTDPALDAKAQACALLQDANDVLEHFPDESAACYSAAGREASGKSNLASNEGVMGIHLHMFDAGEHNAAALGHRRWILSPPLEATGLGTTDGYSCMWIMHPFQNDTAAFVAWPPPGPVPAEAVQGVHPGIGSLDAIGWSIQSNTIDLSAASATVTEDGVERPVQTLPLENNYGSRQAIKIVPDGWRTAVGPTYRVELAGTSAPVAYEFHLVDCGPSAGG